MTATTTRMKKLFRDQLCPLATRPSPPAARGRTWSDPCRLKGPSKTPWLLISSAELKGWKRSWQTRSFFFFFFSPTNQNLKSCSLPSLWAGRSWGGDQRNLDDGAPAGAAAHRIRGPNFQEAVRSGEQGSLCVDRHSGRPGAKGQST